MVTNQSEHPVLELRGVIKSFFAEKCKPSDVYRRMCDVYEKACFSLKMFANGVNMGFSLQARIGKTVPRMETL